jgi:hypothetical protein
MMARPNSWGSRSNREARIKTATLNVVNQLRSPVQQLEALDKRLGKGVGATKERARLKAMIK